LADLQHVIQLSLEWSDEYQHRFCIRNHYLGASRPGGLLFFGDPVAMALSQFAFRLHERFTYEYNLFDAWLFDIRFEGEEAMVSAQVEATWPNKQAARTAVGYTASRVDMKSSCAASSAHFVSAVRASVIAHVREAARPPGGESFSPLAVALPDRTLPERLYLESKWASLVSYGVTARLLEDVLPLDGQENSNGVRRHTHRVARRCERDLLAEPDTEPHAEEWPKDNIPPPKPAITVGLDGGYIRSRDAPSRNEGWFEVIAGKSTVQQGGSSCFAFVHRLDRHARARIGSVLKSQGLVYHQPVSFVTDGGDTVRSWLKRLHPRAEHVIDWFHIAMRFTVLKQMAKGISIPDANPDDPKTPFLIGNCFRTLSDDSTCPSCLLFVIAFEADVDVRCE
jgi:hypothetical protein